MKSNKSYIVLSLLTQMVIIPIVLTVALMASSGILGKSMNTLTQSSLGRNGARFIFLLIAFFGALIVGILVGMIFSNLTKRKNGSAKTRYLTPLIPIMYALIFGILAMLLSKGDFNSSWWGMYVLKNPVFLIFDVVVSLMGLQYIMPVVELAAYVGFLAGVLLHEQISGITIKSRTATNLKITFAALFTAVLVFNVVATRDVISNGIVELNYGKSTVANDLTEFDLLEKAPFREKNGLAQLEKKASLQFNEIKDMPRLDGATAAYPVYAAFVEAVYKGLGDYYNETKGNNSKEMYLAFVSSDQHPYNMVKCSKTVDAYENLINHKTDIIFVAEPSKAQMDKIKEKGDEFVLTPIGSEAFIFFTNKQNPVDNLTTNQIRDIYSGKTTSWKEVGGENKNILPYQRPQDSGSQTIMQNKVMKDIQMQNPTKETYAGGMGEIISQVASYKNSRNSIGYSFMYYSSSMIKNNQIKYIGIDGIKPTTDTVRSKKYPFTVPVYAVTLKSASNENANKFIQWILSDEGQSLVEKTGYVSVK